jgi:flagellin
MSVINTNIASLIAQQNLAKSQSALQTSLTRLSTGLKINTGADDPAGLIASQGLQAEISGITQAVNNSTQATNVISIADGALSQVENLLQTLEGLIVQSANTGALSSTEISANQIQADSAIQSITRIANSTSFDGLQLLDGGLDFVTSGVSNAALSNVQITQADFGTQPTIPVNINVVASAKTAALEFPTSSITQSVVLQIQGNTGVQTLSFVSGTKASAIAFAVNGISDATGVSASLINPAVDTSGIVFDSTGFGSNQFVSVTAQAGGTFKTTDKSGNQEQRAVGADAVATVNGALTVGNGLNLQVNTSALDMNLTLDPNFGTHSTSFTVTGGGARFQLGSQVNSVQQVTLGIQSVAASNLGNNTVGFLNQIETGGNASLVGGGTEKASNIINEAIQQVAVLRGQIGAFQANTLQTNINSLNIALENVTSSESNITDANFASETSSLTRAQILTQAGTSILATANNTPQQVLTLLQGH